MKSKRPFKAILITLVFMAGIMALAGCGKTTPEEILAEYSSYSAVAADENRVGISVKTGSDFGDKRTITISFSNDLINQDENNCQVLTARCRLFDAENPEAEIETGQVSGSVTSTTSNGVSTQFYEGGLTYSKDIKCDYALLRFDGVTALEADDLETPALFFILEVDKNGHITVLTETPLQEK